MIRQYPHSGWPQPTPYGGHSQARARWLFMEVPVCVAVVLSLTWLVPHFVLALRENLESNPEGWRGTIPLALLMGATAFLFILVCAFVAAVIGFLLQVLFVKPPAARSMRAP